MKKIVDYENFLQKSDVYISKASNQLLKLQKMKKTEKIMKASEIATAAKSASANTQKEASALLAERKSLQHTIAFLAKSDSPEAAAWREFWEIKKNANASERRALVAKIEASYINYVEILTISAGNESDEISVSKRIAPSTSTGKEITDYLQVLKSAKIREERRRGVMAALKREALNSDGTVKFELLPKNVQSYLNETPICRGTICVRK